jgi:hypothetical protein
LGGIAMPFGICGCIGGIIQRIAMIGVDDLRKVILFAYSIFKGWIG